MAKGSQYRRFTRSRGGNIIYFSVLILMGLFTVFPLFYCILTSLKPLSELLIFPPKFYVTRPTLRNFTALPALLSNLQVPISRYLFNSVFISVVSTLLSIIAGSLAAFTLSKSRVKGKSAIFTLIL